MPKIGQTYRYLGVGLMPNIEINDIKSFIFGIQVGRRIKVADAQRKLPEPIIPPDLRIVTETGILIISEDGYQLITEAAEQEV